MILDDFIVLDRIGLFCRYGNFYLDPKEPVSEAVISHGHGDHAVGGNREVYCTLATSLFMKQRYKKFAGESFHVIGYGQSFSLREVTLTFLPAGHMLGSAMVLMEFRGIKYLYTGDYKLQDDKTCEPIEFVKADVLITETTFADPNTRHPKAEAEILKLRDTNTNIMLGAYSLGKCQRLIRLITDHCPEKRILLHHSMVPFTKIYQDLGVDVGLFEIYDRKVMKINSDNMIYMVPPMVFNSYFKAINVVRVFATGWKHLQRGNAIHLFISDHSDWDEILRMIDHVSPKQVWTNHGNGKLLQSHYENILDVKILN